MIDFLILFEHRTRELENCVYLENALKKRGYKVKIAYMQSFYRKVCRPKVIITPHLYDDHQLVYFTSSIWNNRKSKVISLQYEQNLAQYANEWKNHCPKGEAKKAYHVAWGANEEKKYIDEGIDEKNVLRLGCLGLDFDCAQNKGYLLPKWSMAEHVGIPVEKKWIVFLSSFGAAGKEEFLVNPVYAKMKTDQEADRKKLLEWFKLLLGNKDFNEHIIIYRKHPVEKMDVSIIKLVKEYPGRFFVNNDLTIRHWIECSDYCVTLTSTSHVDAFFAQKPCYIVRPNPLDKDLEIDTLRGVVGITNYQDFCDALLCNHDSNAMLEEQIYRVYDNNIDETVIEKYIDAFEEILKNNTKRGVVVSKKVGLRLSVVQDILGIFFDLGTRINMAAFLSLIPHFKNEALVCKRELYKLNDDIEFYRKRISSKLSMNR